MFKTLKVENFKVWTDTGEIKMSPITLFFGTNSSGKSSIGQLLMMLKQTVESSDRKTPFYPGGKNSAVQLGSFQDMVNMRDVNKSISFEYSWSIDELYSKSSLDSIISSSEICKFKSEISFNPETNGLYVNGFSYTFYQKEKDDVSIGLIRDLKSNYKIKTNNFTLTRQKGRVWAIKDVVRFYGFPEEVVAYHQNADFVQDINLMHEKLFRSVCYLGPMRNKPERLYSWTGISPESVGYAGENAIPAILSSKERRIGLAYKKKNKPLEEIIAEKLKQMDLIDSFSVKAISDHRQEYEVKVKTKGSKQWVDLPDVGFGVSQVLPVLVQCFYAQPGSIILMEQPEIHLHPKAQSVLADVMIDVIRSRENGKSRDIQLIIETHSEHFLRRLQRRIAEDTIKSEEVSAYFSDISSSTPKLTPLQIDIFGNILNWPENFFGDELTDITEQAKSALKRRIKEKEGISK
ncbi:TPA: DUF3696 domain-containing protein [Klebsiella pneumoniae]|nr:DUF3696 domain-containing protein [Klebsiella pneumoniae]HBQ3918150.1 DUF3696 domain-containing protein [Klebsiella pneumoniae]HBQ3921471.1 DUF3696 domain-containing protein [Klebsiella pneumoniae]HBS6547267.1 DUF3696 domain-containing protein [Klebsiella pneumoniae]HBS6550627.1 DUF3696 domain-containing protein [Klebsiella pneumoniae]